MLNSGIGIQEKDTVAWTLHIRTTSDALNRDDEMKEETRRALRELGIIPRSIQLNVGEGKCVVRVETQSEKIEQAVQALLDKGLTVAHSQDT